MGILWSSYDEALEENPVLTNGCTSLAMDALLFAVIMLYQEAVDDELQPNCVCGSVGAGASLFRTLITYFVYNVLEAFLPGDDGFTVLQKVAVHQGVWIPVSYFFALVWWNIIRCGTRPSEIVPTVMTDLQTIVIDAWSSLTLPVIISFGHVEPKYRILFYKSIEIAFKSVYVIFGHR